MRKEGPILFDESDHIMRDAAYNPELATDKIAVKMTKFIISAANGMPI